MTRILVVDDSETDRELIGGLLAQGGEFDLVYAGDGDEALKALESSLPDLILTDLVMPGKDGLELVAELKERHPFVPVILVTSKGNEKIAVQALQLGAASYVPKQMLDEDLCETVETALSAAAQRRGRSELMKSMRSWRTEFILGNDRTFFTPLIAYIQEGLANFGSFDEADRTRIGIALEEALVNAAEHGNLELDSKLRQEDRQRYVELTRERLGTPPYSERIIDMRATLSAEEALFVIRDDGAGFDWSSLPDPTDPQNLLKVHGRGVMLMRTFMDEVTFNPAGNEVSLVKRAAGTE